VAPPAPAEGGGGEADEGGGGEADERPEGGGGEAELRPAEGGGGEAPLTRVAWLAGTVTAL